MKHLLAALSASVAIGLAGCSDKAPDTPPVDTSKPAITASAPVNETLDTTQIKVFKACDPQNLKTSVEFQEWTKSCDPQVQDFVKATDAWKQNVKPGSPTDISYLISITKEVDVPSKHILSLK